MPVNDAYKRWFDISVLVLAHLLFLPLWILLWMIIPLLIWLEDRKPVFYRQQRMGKDSKPFNVIKFRTMVIDAEEQGPAWTTDDDPRVTRVGHWLRRTALDELPEIISILKGDMSFVGPRALDMDEHQSFEKLIPGFAQRLLVLPGLTGLAQVFDKNDDPYEKYRYDIEYLEKISPILDARLLFLSVWNTMFACWDHRSGKIDLDSLKTDDDVSTADRPGFAEYTASDQEKREL